MVTTKRSDFLCWAGEDSALSEQVTCLSGVEASAARALSKRGADVALVWVSFQVFLTTPEMTLIGSSISSSSFVPRLSCCSLSSSEDRLLLTVNAISLGDWIVLTKPFFSRYLM